MMGLGMVGAKVVAEKWAQRLVVAGLWGHGKLGIPVESKLKRGLCFLNIVKRNVIVKLAKIQHWENSTNALACLKVQAKLQCNLTVNDGWKEIQFVKLCFKG